jgi:hypothetical protein
MSYEGYEQCLCANGHYYCGDDIMFEGDPPCPHCQAPCAWTNEVDETNGPPQGLIDMGALVVEAEVLEVCSLGHQHVTRQAVYRIPSEEEKQHLRQYFDED